MVDELRVALVGYGLSGSRFHAPVLAAVPGLRVTAVVTRDPDRVEQARAELPGAAVLRSADQVWAAAQRYDTVVVAAPNDRHVELAAAAVRAGLPVVVDKPLAVTAADGAALVELAERQHVALSVYHNRRYDADVRTLRRLLAAGELGPVHRFESRFERWRPRPGTGWRERADPAAGGGLLLDLGSHLVDQAVHLFGPVRTVYAEVAARRAGGRSDDEVFVALRHHGGVASHLWASALAGEAGPRLRVLGARGTFVAPALDPQEAALRAGRSPAEPGWGAVPAAEQARLVAGDAVRRVAGEPGDWPAFYAGWRDALLGRGPVPVDPADAVAVLVLLEAARRSAVEERVVPVPYAPGGDAPVPDAPGGQPPQRRRGP